MGFFSRRASGELKKIMSDDVERIELFIAHHIPDIVTALLFPLILVSYMFAVDWRLAIVVLAVLAMAFYVMGRMYTGKKIREVSKRYVETLGRMNASIVEYIRGIQVVKTFTESTNAYRKLNDDIKEYRKFANEVNVQYQPTYVGFLPYSLRHCSSSFPWQCGCLWGVPRMPLSCRCYSVPVFRRGCFLSRA